MIAFGGRVLPGHAAARRSAAQVPELARVADLPQGPHPLRARRWRATRSGERGRVVVVEGYLDVIALAQAGIGEVVAPLGTALTADQLRVAAPLHRARHRVLRRRRGRTPRRRAQLPGRSSRPVSGDAASSCPPATIPTPSCARTAARAFAALLDAAEPLVDAWLAEVARVRDRDAVGRRAEAAREVARLLQRLRPAIPSSTTSLAGRAAQTTRRGARSALRAEGVAARGAGARRAGAARPRGPARGGAHRRAARRRIPTSRSACGRPDVIAEFEHAGWRSRGGALAGRADAAIVPPSSQSLPRELRDRVVRRLLERERRGGARARARRLHRADPGTAACVVCAAACARSSAPPRRVATCRRPPSRRAYVARAPDGENSHVRSATVRTTPATSTTFSPERAAARRRGARSAWTSSTPPSTMPSPTTANRRSPSRRRGRRLPAAPEARRGTRRRRSRPSLSQADGAGVAPDARGRGRDREAHRGGRARASCAPRS